MMHYESAAIFNITMPVPIITQINFSQIPKGQALKIKIMETDSHMIDKEEALRVAHKDAKMIYKDFSIYDIKAELKDGKWYVDYEINVKNMLGGGPHYVISAETGKILSYRYEQ
uniref:hypothetical protein n=1 Tax=Candidatus Electrothrix sp. TaxID=2170559 RepID=UPI0040578729